HLAGGKPETARAHQIDADEIAVLGAAGISRSDIQFAAGLLLVDRNQPATAAGQASEDSEHAGLGATNDLDDAPALGGAIALIEFLVPQRRAIADTCGDACLRRPGTVDADFRGLAVLYFIPSGGRRD